MTSTRDPQTSPVEDIRPRTVLEGLPAYVPGRPAPDDGKTRYKVSSNESPFPPLAPVAEAVAEAARTANRYPDMAAYALREALAADHGVELSQISVATGSVGVTGDLIRALVDPGDEVVYAWRSFEAYPILVGTHGGTSVQVPLTPAFEHDLEAMADAVTERTKLVLLCTPNNPTGPSLTTAQIQDFVARVPSHVVVAIDEAYREFVDPVRSPDTARLFREHGNVVLLRTFSKLQGIAGLRLGWAVAHPRLARALAQVTLPFGASSIAQAAGLATLTADARAELDHRAAHIRTERARVQQALAAQGWELPDTQGNFVYFPLGEDTGTFTDFCWDRGLVVRGYVGDGVRITIAETEANDLTIAVAGEWLTR